MKKKHTTKEERRRDNPNDSLWDLLEEWNDRFEEGHANYSDDACAEALMRGLCFCASLRPDPRAAFAKLIEFGSEWLEEWLKEASTMADDNGNATN